MRDLPARWIEQRANRAKGGGVREVTEPMRGGGARIGNPRAQRGYRRVRAIQ